MGLLLHASCSTVTACMHAFPHRKGKPTHDKLLLLLSHCNIAPTYPGTRTRTGAVTTEQPKRAKAWYSFTLK